MTTITIPAHQDTYKHPNKNEDHPCVRQAPLFTCIMSHILKEYPTLNTNHRHINTIYKAASRIAGELNIPHRPATPNMGLEAWMKCDEVGRSSAYMAFILSNHKTRFAEYALPAGVDDFNRCCKLLSAEPKLIDNIPRLAKKSEDWRRLINHWDDITDNINNENWETALKLIQGS